jgi:hypothetical protein
MKKIILGLALLVLAGCGPNLNLYNKQQSERAISKSDTGGYGASWGRPTLELAVFESLLRCQAFNPAAVCRVEYLNNSIATEFDKSEWQRKFQSELSNYEQFVDTLYDPGNGKMSNIVALKQKQTNNISKNKITEITKPIKDNIETTKPVKENIEKNKINDSKFQKKCEGGVFTSGFKKGTVEYDECIKKEEKLAALEEQKIQLLNEDKNKKLVLLDQKKQKVNEDKKKQDVDKEKEELNKLAKMSPDDRRAYTCSEKFGFRKGSDKFKDCVFKIYSAEIELEKLELQKQLAKANADLARANSDRQDRLALAQTETARMQAYAAQQQAIAANTADSLALMESGLRMLSPQRPAVAPMRTCTYNRNFMNCF